MGCHEASKGINDALFDASDRIMFLETELDNGGLACKAEAEEANRLKQLAENERNFAVLTADKIVGEYEQYKAEAESTKQQLEATVE